MQNSFVLTHLRIVSQSVPTGCLTFIIHFITFKSVKDMTGSGKTPPYIPITETQSLQFTSHPHPDIILNSQRETINFNLEMAPAEQQPVTPGVTDHVAAGPTHNNTYNIDKVRHWKIKFILFNVLFFTEVGPYGLDSGGCWPLRHRFVIPLIHSQAVIGEYL